MLSEFDLPTSLIMLMNRQVKNISCIRSDQFLATSMLSLDIHELLRLFIENQQNP